MQNRVVDLEYVELIFSENPGLIGYWSRFRPVVALMSEAHARIVDKIAQNSLNTDEN
jgi:hypothetical protein